MLLPRGNHSRPVKTRIVFVKVPDARRQPIAHGFPEGHVVGEERLIIRRDRIAAGRNGGSLGERAKIPCCTASLARQHFIYAAATGSIGSWSKSGGQRQIVRGGTEHQRFQIPVIAGQDVSEITLGWRVVHFPVQTIYVQPVSAAIDREGWIVARSRYCLRYIVAPYDGITIERGGVHQSRLACPYVGARYTHSVPSRKKTDLILIAAATHILGKVGIR